jgi:hypothetical protein
VGVAVGAESGNGFRTVCDAGDSATPFFSKA